MGVDEAVMDRRSNVLGVGISAVDMGMAVDRMEGWVEAGSRAYVCVTGVHGVMESWRDSELRGIHNRAGLVTPDGMPMVWLSRLEGFGHVERVYGPDLMAAVLERSAEAGHRHFLYGGGPGVAERLGERLRQRFPGVRIVGAVTPPEGIEGDALDAEAVERINDSGADVVWVGLSTPKQERWMARHRDVLTASVLVGVGAAFDFHAGLKSQAPGWMQRAGLEWLFRLCAEPRRLWRRYLRNNPLFVWWVLMQWCGVKRFDIRSG